MTEEMSLPDRVQRFNRKIHRRMNSKTISDTILLLLIVIDFSCKVIVCIPQKVVNIFITIVTTQLTRVIFSFVR